MRRCRLTLPTARSLAPALALLVAVGGCEVDKGIMLAPSDATIAVTSSADFLPIHGSATLTVLVTLDGKPVPDGTDVLLTASLGELAQRRVRVRGGSAQAHYRAGNEIGIDRIQVASGSAAATFELPIGSGAVAQVLLAAFPAVVPVEGGVVDLTAMALTSAGQPVVGVPISFSASAGSLTPTEPVMTNAQGRAMAQLRTSEATTVRARALAFASGEVQVPIRYPVELSLRANPSQPVAGQTVTFTVTATQGGSPALGTARIEFGNGQTAQLGQIVGTATATHVFLGGGFNVTAVFVEGDGTEVRSTIRVEVSNPPTPGPTPSPNPVPGGDAIDPRTIIWLSPASTDVSNWTVTSTITSVDIRGDDICINHTKAGRWPLVSIDDNPPNIEGNPMIVVRINGQWYGAGFDWFGEGRTCKHMPAVEYGRDQIRVHPLDHTWPGPRSGDQVGLLVSTPSSDRIRARTLNERTNIVLVRWP